MSYVENLFEKNYHFENTQQERERVNVGLIKQLKIGFLSVSQDCISGLYLRIVSQDIYR